MAGFYEKRSRGKKDLTRGKKDLTRGKTGPTRGKHFPEYQLVTKKNGQIHGLFALRLSRDPRSARALISNCDKRYKKV